MEHSDHLQIVRNSKRYLKGGNDYLDTLISVLESKWQNLNPRAVVVVLLQCIMHMSMYFFEHLMTAYKQVNILSTLALQASPLFSSIEIPRIFCSRKSSDSRTKVPGNCSVPGQGFPETIYSRELFDSRTRVLGIIPSQDKG